MGVKEWRDTVQWLCFTYVQKRNSEDLMTAWEVKLKLLC